MAYLRNALKTCVKSTRYAPLLIGGSIAIGVVIASAVLTIVQGRLDAHRAAEATTTNISKTLADQFISIVDSADQGLQTIIDEYDHQKSRGELNGSEMLATISRQDKRHPNLVGYRLFGLDGHLLYAVNNVSTRSGDISTRDDFVYLRDHQDAGLIITPPVVGSVSREWLISFARRINNVDGSFGGAVYTSITEKQLVKFYSTLDLGTMGTVALYHNSYRLAARFPLTHSATSPTGTATISDKLRVIITESIPSVQYDYVSSIDSISRTANVRKIDGTPYFVLAGMAETDYLAEWIEDRNRTLIFTTIVVSLILLGILLMSKRIIEQEQIDAQYRLTAGVFNSTAEAIIISDPDGNIISANPAFSRITGWLADEVIGKNPRILKSEHHEAEFYKNMWSTLHREGMWQGRIWNRAKGGGVFLAWETITALRDNGGAITHFIGVFGDITEAHEKDEQIRHQAYHDALTGLPNRLLLQDRLEHAVEIARRKKSEIAVMFVDLDRFKTVNDSLGHNIGDQLLIQTSQRLSMCLRKSDTVSRLGGDEFVVLLSDFDDPVEIADVAEKLIKSVSEPMTLKGHEVHVGASIGIALFPRDGDAPTALMKNADTAMYRAKSSGRSCFCFFDAEMDGAAVERLRLEGDLRHAIDNGEFQLHYQPKIRLIDGALAGVEALIRWHSPERGLVPPGSFIPVAEDSGLILAVGDWVLNEACRQIADWKSRGLHLRVAVNVSAHQFLDVSFVTKVKNLLTKHLVSPSLLDLEITESTVMADPDKVDHCIGLLRKIGVTISIDDFGTGYSSLGHLRHLPLDYVKIDRSFVCNLDKVKENSAIVKAIIVLSETLGMDSVAEGIETIDELEYLKKIGCPEGQGFIFSKALPPALLEKWIADYRPIC